MRLPPLPPHRVPQVHPPPPAAPSLATRSTPQQGAAVGTTWRFGASPTKTPGTMEPAAGGLFFRGPKCGSWARSVTRDCGPREPGRRLRFDSRRHTTLLDRLVRALIGAAPAPRLPRRDFTLARGAAAGPRVPP